MRILVLIHEFPPVGGGGGRVARDLCLGLVHNGHDVKVLTADMDGIKDDHQTLGFSVERVISGRREAFRADLRAMGGYVWAGFWAARELIKDWKPDLIHVHFAVPGGPIAWLLSKIYHIPYVLTTHLGDVPEGVPEKTREWFRWIYPLTPPVWKGAARIVAVSEHTRRLALARYPVEIIVIPNGVDTHQIMPDVLVENDPPRILFAGRFMEQKNPLQLVRVLAGLKDLPWTCEMFGDGPLRPDVENAIRGWKLIERINLRGWVEPEVVLSEFACSEILFMPSRSEGLPVVGVQALAAGLAVVAGNAGGFRDLVQNGENGYIFDPDDVDGMRQGLRTLLIDPSALLRARKSSLRLAEKFDLTAIVSKYEDLFKIVIQRCKS